MYKCESARWTNEYGRLCYGCLGESKEYEYTYIIYGEMVTLYWEDGDFEGYNTDSITYTLKQLDNMVDIGLVKIIF